MKKYAEIDKAHFPLVYVRFTGHPAEAENFKLYLDELRESYARKEPLALLFDAREASLPAYRYQRMQAQWLKENHELMKDFCAGTAYIIPNAMLRSVLRFILFLQAQPVAYSVFEEPSEAEAWAKQQLEKKKKA